MSVIDLFCQRAFAAGVNASLLATLLLGVVWLWLRLARGRSASFRALVWMIALTVTLTLPAALALAPIVSRPAADHGSPSAVVPMPAARVGSGPAPVVNQPASSMILPADRAPRLEWQAAVTPSVCRLVVAVWLGGAALVLGRFILGNVLLSRRRRRADLSLLSTWREPADYALRLLGVDQALRLVPDESTITPTVWAGRVPTVFLPRVTDWSDERKRVVLLHEFAHIKRGDPQTLWLKQLAAALYWFHPAVLFGLKESNVACEQACDDMVLNAGVRSTDYATHLLEISAELSEPDCPQAVMSVLGTQPLERRVVSILGASVPRGTTHPLIWAAAGMTAMPVVMALVAARPFEPSFVTAPRVVPPPAVAPPAAQSAPAENSARTQEPRATSASHVQAPTSLPAPAAATIDRVPETPVSPPANSFSAAVPNGTRGAGASSEGIPSSTASPDSDRVETPTTATVTATPPSSASAVIQTESDSNTSHQAELSSAAAASSIVVTPPTVAAPASCVLSAGTKVWLIHTANLTSATATQGETVDLMLVKDLTVGDAIVAKAGTPVVGTVIHVEKARVPAHRGVIELRLDYLRVGDRTVKLQTTPDRTDAVVQYRSPFSLKWPLGVFGAGYEATVPAGTGVIAYIAENVTMPPQS